MFNFIKKAKEVVEKVKEAKPFMARQGDVLIRSTSIIKSEAQIEHLRSARDDQGRIILALGEVTGHAHAIHDPGVIAYSLKDNRMLLDVPKTGASVVHEEHGSIELPPGQYEVIRQREWNDSEQSKWAYVAD